MLTPGFKENEITISLRGPVVDQILARIRDSVHVALPALGLQTPDKLSNSPSKQNYSIPEACKILNISRQSLVKFRKEYQMQEVIEDDVTKFPHAEVHRVFLALYGNVLSSYASFAGGREAA